MWYGIDSLLGGLFLGDASDMARLVEWLWKFSAALGLVVLVSCGSGGGSEERLTETVLTLEMPALELEAPWEYFKPASIEYQIGLGDEAEPGQPLTGELGRVARGAANFAELGEPTDVLRAWVELPPGRHGIEFRFRDDDREVIYTTYGPLRVPSDVPTEWYLFFDPRSFDPPPVFRTLLLNVDTPKDPVDFEIDHIEYDITCGYDPGELLKTSYACGTRTEGVLALAGEGLGGVGQERVPVDLWQATHELGCGPCELRVDARDAVDAAVCHAELTFDVEGWRSREMPAEQLFLSLICAGVSE